MDDDDVVRDFSRDIIFDFLKQAGGTTAEIQEAMYVSPLVLVLPNLLAAPISIVPLETDQSYVPL